MSHPVELAAFEPDLAPNLGSIIRVGVCFDAPIHVIEPCGFPFSVKAVQTRALDYADKADLRHHDDWQEFQQATVSNRTLLLTTKGTTDLWDFEFQKGDIILVGRESAGVPEYVHETVDSRVLIPMPGDGRSLNVAIAAAMAIAEATRQLR